MHVHKSPAVLHQLELPRLQKKKNQNYKKKKEKEKGNDAIIMLSYYPERRASPFYLNNDL